jgi:type II secretory pathway component PulK
LTCSVRVGIEEMKNRKEHLRSYYLARGAVLTTALFLAQGSLQPQEGSIQPGQQVVAWREDPGRTSVEITDENGKIDLNQVPEAVLERLLVALGSDLQSARSVATAIVDWRTPSSLARWNIAVASGNLAQFDSTQQGQIDYRSVEELVSVPGIVPDLLYGRYIRHEDGKIERQLGLIDCVTVDSKSSQININYASYPVLMAIPEMTSQVADYIRAARQTNPFQSPSDLTSQFPASLSAATLSTLTTQSSGRFTLSARGWAEGEVVAQVQALVNVRGASNAPFQILRWKDSYVQ